jgi:hypothetical protein
LWSIFSQVRSAVFILGEKSAFRKGRTKVELKKRSIAVYVSIF